jgi:hypothetical protein
MITPHLSNSGSFALGKIPEFLKLFARVGTPA